MLGSSLKYLESGIVRKRNCPINPRLGETFFPAGPKVAGGGVSPSASDLPALQRATDSGTPFDVAQENHHSSRAYVSNMLSSDRAHKLTVSCNFFCFCF
jgi:hypothetical protein